MNNVDNSLKTEKIKISDPIENIYTKVVNEATVNGYVWLTWIQNMFDVNKYTAAYILQRMEKEGLCEKPFGTFPERKMIIH